MKTTDRMDAGERTQKNNGLQILRAVAAFSIFFYHSSGLHGVNSEAGALGVSIFLMLSGYLAMEKQKQNQTAVNRKTQPAVWRNIVRRIGKLYFLHILMLLASIPFMVNQVIEAENRALAVHKAGLSFIANIFMVQGFVPDYHVYFSYNGVAWYLTIVLAIAAFGDVLLKWMKRLAEHIKVVPVLLLLILVDLGWTILFRNHRGAMWLIYINPLFRLVDYLIGGMLCALSLDSKIRSRAGSAVLLCVSFLVAGAVSGLAAYMGANGIYTSFIYVVLELPAAALLLVAFATAGKVFAIPNRSPFVLFGNVTMAFFLIHQVLIKYVLNLAGKIWPFGFQRGIGILLCLCTFALTLVFSALWQKGFVSRYERNRK